ALLGRCYRLRPGRSGYRRCLRLPGREALHRREPKECLAKSVVEASRGRELRICSRELSIFERQVTARVRASRRHGRRRGVAERAIRRKSILKLKEQTVREVPDDERR